VRSALRRAILALSIAATSTVASVGCASLGKSSGSASPAGTTVASVPASPGATPLSPTSGQTVVCYTAFRDDSKRVANNYRRVKVVMSPGSGRRALSYGRLRAEFRRTGGEQPTLSVRVFARRRGESMLLIDDRYGLPVTGSERLVNQLARGNALFSGASEFGNSFSNDSRSKDPRSGQEFIYQCNARGKAANRLGEGAGVPTGVEPELECHVSVLERDGRVRTTKDVVLDPDDPGVQVAVGRLTLWVHRLHAFEDDTNTTLVVSLKPRGPYEERQPLAAVSYKLPEADQHKLLNQLRGFAGDPQERSFTGGRSYTDLESGLTVEHSCRSLEPGA
jgi:hypothetical protein